MRFNFITGILIISLVLPLVIASDIYEEKKIYEGYAPYGQEFTADGHMFLITGASDMSTIILNMPGGESVTFRDAGCSASETYLACFNGSTEFDYMNYTIDKLYNKAYINISFFNRTTQVVSIQKTIKHEEPAQVQDPIYVTLTLYNNASIFAKGIILKDQVPEEFTITESQGCENFGNNIRWYGNLATHEYHSCRYTIVPTDNTVYSTKAYVEYILEDEEKTAESNSVSIEIIDPRLNITSYVRNRTLNVGDYFYYELNLTNVDPDENLDLMRMTIVVPDNLEVLEHHYKIRSEKQGLIHKGDYKPGENNSLYFIAGVDKKGNATLSVTFSYKIREIKAEYTIYENLTFLNPKNIDENQSFREMIGNNTIGNESELYDIAGNNASETDNIAEVDNVATPIITTVNDKRPVSNAVVFIIVGGILVMIAVIFFIKKRRDAYY